MVRRLLYVTVWAVALLSYLTYVWLVRPPCMTYKMFGVYCSGCGITRMVMSTTYGNFYQAFRYNPFMFVTAPWLLVIGGDLHS